MKGKQPLVGLKGSVTTKSPDSPVKNPKIHRSTPGILRFHPHVWMLHAEPSEIFHDFSHLRSWGIPPFPPVGMP